MTTTPAPLVRRLAAEAAGTTALAAVVVGSGIQAAALSSDGAVRFLANVGASAFALAVLIELLGPVSGGHFNPLVTAGAWWAGRRDGSGPAPTMRELGAYAAAQTAGAVAGTGLANVMFGRPFAEPSGHGRDGTALWLGEVVATGTLMLVVAGLAGSGRRRLVPAAVGLWVGAAGWATSSGGFANPAVTLGRTLTDSYTGIAFGSVPGFVLAQLTGAAVGVALAAVLFGRSRAARPTAVPDDARRLVAG
ncbi:aquaporin [Kitasatospora sp. NBC_00085]|uniref:aquaporin n=1 Tax=unclassified Kitasatospora TaxID=2633591 RepID=UPI003245A5B7